MAVKKYIRKDAQGQTTEHALGADAANVDVSAATAAALGLPEQEADLETVLGQTMSKTGDVSNATVAFTAAETRANLTTGEKLSVAFGKLAKWLADLKTVAFTGKYSDLSGVPDLSGYAAKSALVDATIGTTWGGAEGAWTQTLAVTGVTAGNTNHVKPADSATAEQRKAFFALQLRDRNRDGQAAGKIYLLAEGTVNTIAIPVTVTVMGDG